MMGEIVPISVAAVEIGRTKMERKSIGLNMEYTNVPCEFIPLQYVVEEAKLFHIWPMPFGMHKTMSSVVRDHRWVLRE
jgi:hypothetical protein